MRAWQTNQSIEVAFLLGVFLALALITEIARAEIKQTKPGSHTMAIHVDGLERTYIVHVPASYNPSIATPMVVMLHGGGGTARAAMWETEWVDKANKEGFLAVFPNALARDPARSSHFSRNPQLWNDGSERFYPDQKAPDDVRRSSPRFSDK
jgi:polyhydroxybutyrate depolymerase